MNIKPIGKLPKLLYLSIGLQFELRCKNSHLRLKSATNFTYRNSLDCYHILSYSIIGLVQMHLPCLYHWTE